MQLPAPPRAARRFSRRIDLRTVAAPRARSAAPPSGMMYATSLAILASIEARPPPRWPETSYFCRPSVPASARVARVARAPGARCELGVPRASVPRSGGACAAARGHRRAARYCCVGGLRASRRKGAAAASERLDRVWDRVADLISAHGRRSSPSPSALGPSAEFTTRPSCAAAATSSPRAVASRRVRAPGTSAARLPRRRR